MTEIFHFEFDAGGTVSAARINDGWSRELTPDQFADAAFLSYLRARSAHRVSPIPPEEELSNQERSRVLRARLREAREKLRTVPDAQDEPYLQDTGTMAEVTDRRTRFTITTRHGQPDSITVNEAWLRTADLSDVEHSLVETLQALEGASETA
ncbi:hypothetical protein [Tessaracoccus massiliensis]|uniref:hypothetical protein n=1 Tax=Tessaracoccus massiliensis TaxID=1522311 RepID=UPI00058BB285|nr:hypothetical protein [Tessaracoccus massiliensis]